MKFSQPKSILYSIVFAFFLTAGCSPTSPIRDDDYQKKLDTFIQTATARSETEKNLKVTPNGTNLNDSMIPTIQEELNHYNVPTDSGSLGWIHPPAQLFAQDNQQLLMKYEYPDIKAKDFVLAADITWETEDPSSGCGFAFRVNGNEAYLNQYILIITRMENGYFMFTALHQGIISNLREVYADSKDTSFDNNNSATNHLALVVKESDLKIYSNKTFIQSIDTSKEPLLEPNLPPAPVLLNDTSEYSQNYDAVKQSYDSLVQVLSERYKTVANTFQVVKPIYSHGYAGLAVLNTIGMTTCNFVNAWLWIINP